MHDNFFTFFIIYKYNTIKIFDTITIKLKIIEIKKKKEKYQSSI